MHFVTNLWLPNGTCVTGLHPSKNVLMRFQQDRNRWHTKPPLILQSTGFYTLKLAYCCVPVPCQNLRLCPHISRKIPSRKYTNVVSICLPFDRRLDSISPPRKSPQYQLSETHAFPAICSCLEHGHL